MDLVDKTGADCRLIRKRCGGIVLDILPNPLQFVLQFKDALGRALEIDTALNRLDQTAEPGLDVGFPRLKVPTALGLAGKGLVERRCPGELSHRCGSAPDAGQQALALPVDADVASQ